MIDGITKAKAALRRHLDSSAGRSVVVGLPSPREVRATRSDWTQDQDVVRGGFHARKMSNFTIHLDDGIDPTLKKQTLRDLKTGDELKVVGHRSNDTSHTLICTDLNG